MSNKDSEYKQQQNLHATAYTEQHVEHYLQGFKYVPLEVNFVDFSFESS